MIRNVRLCFDKQIARDADNALIRAAAGRGWQLRLGNWVIEPDQWVHWTLIWKTTYRERNGIDSDDVNKLGKRLQNSLQNYNYENFRWIISLLSECRAPDATIHWKLVVRSRHDQKNSSKDDVLTSDSVKSPQSFPPEFIWQIDGADRGLPVWLPFDPTRSIDFSVKICSEWARPPMFPNYDKFKERSWKRSKVKTDSDNPICSFKGFRKLTALASESLPIEIDAALARYSDYCATNGQLIKWNEEEGESKRVKGFKLKLGLIDEQLRFPINAANPISISVILFTKDKKTVFIRDKDLDRWDSPAWDLLDPFQDVQRTCPFGISPQETVIRTVYCNLGVPIHRQSVRWNALAFHRETGLVNLLGEIEIGLESKQVESYFKCQKGKVAPPPAFIEFTPEAVLEFFKTTGKAWPRHILEIALVLALNRRFPQKVKILQPQSSPADNGS